jgi:CheY-like chemotaxis protein
MRILVLEDEDVKLEQLTQVIVDRLPGCDVQTARSLNSGLRCLEATAFDLLILDMSVPSFDVTESDDGGAPQAFAGFELVRFLRWKRNSARVIVFTQFDRFGSGDDSITLDELTDRIRGELGEKYVGSVFYDAAAVEWQRALSGLLDDMNISET